MPGLLDHPEVREQVFPISVETYERMVDQGLFDAAPVELVQGLLIRKMSKSKLHVHVLRVLFSLLRDAVPSSFEVRKEDPLLLERSEPEPDLSVIPFTDPAEGVAEKPTSAALVVEVAITSLSLDRDKAWDYARAAVPEYWIVRPADAKVEVYTRPDPARGEYLTRRIFEASETLQSSQFPKLMFRLGDWLPSDDLR